jgi:class 3 adenylate cyclase/predicted negative regulator of RcsB-dependent stress response
MDARATLEASGVDRDVAAALADALESAPEGVLDAEDRGATEPRQLVLHAALVALAESSRFPAALQATIEWLEARVPELSRYDAARFWHVRAVVAWRLDDSMFAATRALNASARLLRGDSSPRGRGYLARVFDTTGQLLHQQGMLADARRELERALALREETGDRVGEAITLGNLGRLCMDLGDFASAADYLARDLALVEARNPERTRVRAQLRSHLGDCELRLGAIDAAEASFRASGELGRAAENATSEAFAALGLGQVALARGDATSALGVASATLSRVDALPPSARDSLLASVKKLAGDAQLVLGDHDAAIASYRDAAHALVATPRTSPIEHAEVQRGLAFALAAKRELPEAARSLRVALRHLDMTAAASMRTQVEAELKRASYDSWLLHSAGRFIGQQQIEILLSEAGLEGFRGARRHAIVLFSDLRGFTSLSERLPADELVLLLNDFLALMTRCIDRHGGTVDKFIGDSVMAVFSAEDGGATRAIAAAVAMHGELERFDRRLGELGATLGMGIGIHAGDVVGGLIGSPQKRELTVIGDVVNTASRVEGMTKQLGATTLVTEAVLSGADRSRFLARPVGTFAPKGRRGGVRVYDILGERDRTPDSAALEREIVRAEAAVALFEAREFTRAADAFVELEGLASGTSRVVGYLLLAAKSRELARNAPPATWAGEISLAEK